SADTIRTEFVIPVPRQAAPVAPPVNVTVAVPVDSLADAYRQGAEASQMALAEAIKACGCADSGPPNWFWAGALTLGAGFLYRYWTKDSGDVNVDVREGDEDITVTLPPREHHRHPPYKHKHKGKKDGHGHE